MYMPRVIHIDITNRCNLACVHCRQTAQYTPNELTVEEFKRIVEGILSHEDSCIEWVSIGGGEPLLKQDLEKFVSFISSNGIKSLITTNGTLATVEKIKKLKDVGLTRFQVNPPHPKGWGFLTGSLCSI